MKPLDRRKAGRDWRLVDELNRLQRELEALEEARELQELREAHRDGQKESEAQD